MKGRKEKKGINEYTSILSKTSGEDSNKMTLKQGSDLNTKSILSASKHFDYLEKGHRRPRYPTEKA